MLKIIQSDYTSFGDMKLDDAVQSAKSRGETILLADLHTLKAATSFALKCKNNDVKGLVGVKLRIGVGDEQGIITFVAKNQKGLESLSKIVEKHHDGACIEFRELLGKLSDVSCIVDQDAPFVDGSTRQYSRLTNGLTRLVGAGNIKYAFHVNKGEFYNDFPSLKSHNEYIGENTDLDVINNAIPVNMASFRNSTLSYSLAIGRYIHLNPKKNIAFKDAKKAIVRWHGDSYTPSVIPTLLSNNLQSMISTSGFNYSILKDEYIDDIGVSVDVNGFVQTRLDDYLQENPLLNQDTYRERLSLELSIISQLGFDNYFKVLLGFSEHCMNHSIPIPISLRGSAVSSLVCFLAGLTPKEVDPVAFDLDFRRFMGARLEYPDVDIEIPSEFRNAFFEYAIKYVGAGGIAALANQSELIKLDSLLHIAREAVVFSSGEGDLDNITVPRDGIRTCWRVSKLKNAIKKELGDRSLSDMDLKEILSKSSELRRITDNDPYLKVLVQYANSAYGSKGNPSRAATAIVISTDSWVPFVGTLRSSSFQNMDKSISLPDEICLAELTGKEATAAGLVKYDIISSRLLSSLKIATELISSEMVSAGFSGDDLISDYFKSQGLDTNSLLNGTSSSSNGNIFDFICDNPTSINQLAQRYGQRVLAEVKPKNMAELVATYALTRPAITDDERARFSTEALDAEVIDSDLTLLGEGNAFDDMAVAGILSKTKGALIFDEQILKISIDVGGLTGLQADSLRTGLKNGKQHLIDSVRADFVSGATNSSRNEDQAKAIFDKLETYKNKYTFNEAHATVYAVQGIKEAIIKMTHPHVFLQAFILSKDDRKERLSLVCDFNKECNQRGIMISGIDINRSNALNVGFSKSLVIPSLVMVGVKQQIAESIDREKHRNGDFEGLEDFIDRMIGEHIGSPHLSCQKVSRTALRDLKESVTELVFMGAFDSVGMSPEMTLTSVDTEVKRNALESIGIQYINNCVEHQSSVKEIHYAGEINMSLSDMSAKIKDAIGVIPTPLCSGGVKNTMTAPTHKVKNGVR